MTLEEAKETLKKYAEYSSTSGESSVDVAIKTVLEELERLWYESNTQFKQGQESVKQKLIEELDEDIVKTINNPNTRDNMDKYLIAVGKISKALSIKEYIEEKL